MKKFMLILALVFTSQTIVFTQDCLPEGIIFTTQSQLDSFQINYPGCNEISGDVTIGVETNNSNITHLDNLNVLIEIGGGLFIRNNHLLSNLDGLENLTSVGDYCIVENNQLLVNLQELSNLTYIGNYLTVHGNNNLTDLTGLAEGIHIVGYISITGNPLLNNITALEGKTTLTGLRLIENTSLTNLLGLESITNVHQNVVISGNNLTSLSDLGKLTSVGGDLRIAEDNLSTYAGLDSLKLIGGKFTIDFNIALESLNGLNNLASIGENLQITNNEILSSLNGLENLTNVQGSVFIRGNSSLTDITGIGNISTIESNLTISNNPQISSLLGLENINLSSLSHLYIYGNNSLSECTIQSICDFLNNPYGITNIDNNAVGCNSKEEVEESCPASVEEMKTQDITLFYPNPAFDFITLNMDALKSVKKIRIFNQLGKIVLSTDPEQPEIDISNLSTGTYFIEVKTKEKSITRLLVKQ